VWGRDRIIRMLDLIYICIQPDFFSYFIDVCGVDLQTKKHKEKEKQNKNTTKKGLSFLEATQDG